MRHTLTALLLLLLVAASAQAQDADTTRAAAVQDALYERPFIGGLGGTSVGGYLEGNTNYFVEDGITDGFSMELRRFNIFLFSALHPRIRFISELEFEHGTEEIALETALLDVQVHPMLVVRGGILLPPIGAFNQNHDSPLWEFVDRPLVSTEIIPATLSKVFRAPYLVTYDLYLTNGLGDGVVQNAEGRTYLPGGKRAEQFGEDNNGSPAVSGRLAARHTRAGEVGVSFYTALYNTFTVEGERIDAKRRATLLAVDYAAALPRGIAVRGEAALARIDVPEGLAEVFGDRQWGAFVDVVVPLWRPRAPLFADAVLNAVLRLEGVDYNVGTFSTTGQRIRDELYAGVVGVSFRPVPGTVFRAGYRRHWRHDLVGNPAARGAGIQVGLASYF